MKTQNLMALALAILLVLSALTFLEVRDGVPATPDVLTCQEDEAIVGQGDYSEGQWDTYHCVTIDDLAPAV